MDPGKSLKQDFCSVYHRDDKNKYETFNETKPHQNLFETDVSFEEFSFDDVFTYGQDIEVESVPKQKSPEQLLNEIAKGVKKAIAKVGM